MLDTSSSLVKVKYHFCTERQRFPTGSAALRGNYSIHTEGKTHNRDLPQEKVPHARRSIVWQADSRLWEL